MKPKFNTLLAITGFNFFEMGFDNFVILKEYGKFQDGFRTSYFERSVPDQVKMDLDCQEI
jgi:hypothetical protein